MSEYIASTTNEFVKSTAGLKQKKYRDQSGLFIAEGVHLVKEVLNSKRDIEACIFTSEAKSNKEAEELLHSFAVRGCRMVEVSLPVYDKISDTENGQGIMTIVKKMQYSLSKMGGKTDTKRVFVVLDGLQDPGNVGTIIRTADAAGCAGVLMTKGCADLYSGKTVRATMGSLFHLPVVEGITTSDLVDFCQKQTVKLFATALDASELYYEANLAETVALVFGNEGQGVSQELLGAADKKLYIPMYGQAESLNVAISAAVILYEAARQCRLSL